MRTALPGLITVTLLSFGTVLPCGLLRGDEPTATAVDAAGADPIAVEADRSSLDQATNYRYDPIGRQLWPIPRASLRPGCVYLTFATDLDAWTWSQWMGEQGFRYSMGPGSIQPGERFHLTFSDAEGMQAIEARSPELARKFEIQGAKPVLRLDEDGSWRLNPTSCGARVFDERTGQRWEWHGFDRAAVVHFGGNHWRYEDGRYVPSYR